VLPLRLGDQSAEDLLEIGRQVGLFLLGQLGADFLIDRVDVLADPPQDFLTFRSQANHHLAAVRGLGSTLDEAVADQAVDRSGQGRAVGGRQPRQARHRAFAEPRQRRQRHPLGEAQSVLRDAVGRQGAPMLLGLVHQVADIGRQRQTAALPLLLL
jgi:hypothetical protein